MTIKTKTKQNLKEIVYVNWEESEREWGVRPDGCSLHLTEEDYKKFEKKYWARMPKEVPYEYSRPAGKMEKAYVVSGLYKKIQKEKDGCGLRFFKFDEDKLRRKKELVYGKRTSGWVPLEGGGSGRL